MMCTKVGSIKNIDFWGRTLKVRVRNSILMLYLNWHSVMPVLMVDHLNVKQYPLQRGKHLANTCQDYL